MNLARSGRTQVLVRTAFEIPDYRSSGQRIGPFFQYLRPFLIGGFQNTKFARCSREFPAISMDRATDNTANPKFRANAKCRWPAWLAVPNGHVNKATGRGAI